MVKRYFVLLLLAAVAAAAPKRPNILFIYADDHAASALGCYGSPAARTPRLDRLAAEGVVFDNAFCTNAICAPARAVVLTGKHSHKNGVRDNRDKFDGTQTTFPKLLRAAGYQTALIGKWHLKSDPTGFDHWDILPGQGHYYGPVFRSAYGRRRLPGYVTDVTTDLALEWLASRDPDKPFLLMLQHKAPHRTWMPGPAHLTTFAGETIPEPPTLFDDWKGRSRAASMQEMTIRSHLFLYYDLKLTPPAGADLAGPDRSAASLLDRMSADERKRWDAAFAPGNEAFAEAGLSGDALVRWKYQRYLKDYLRCVASVDDNVGRVLDWLERRGLARNTVVVYTSDQGFFLGEHGYYDKRFMYEPALRVPLIVRWPGVTKPGTRARALVQNLDFAATLLDIAGVEPPADQQGASFAPFLRGDAPARWRTSIYYQYFEKGVHNVQPHYGVRTDRHKLIYFPGLDEWELYDLQADPNEVHNLASDPRYVELRATLTRELARLRKVYGVE